jgi:zinc transport system substrate-binding protein
MGCVMKKTLKLTLAGISILTAIIWFQCIAFATPSTPLTIYTVNYPLAYFAERIGTDHVKVVFPAPSDVDPAYWMPDKGTITRYQKADLILLNGAHYAKWVEKVTLPRAKMINTSRKFKDRYIRMAAEVTHSHGAEGKHAHEDAAFTVWLDFQLAVMQAKAIEKALSRKMPEQSSAFKKNLAALEKDLQNLDQGIKKIFSIDKDKPLLASHPVYDYLQRKYSLDLKSVHWEPDEEISYSQWNELQEILQAHPAKWMIWEGKPMKKSVEKLQESGINSLVFDPCGNRPDKGDFLTVMQANIENLRKAYN